MRPEILLIGKYFPPFKGGIETHVYDLCTCLKDSVSLTVLAANQGFRTIKEHVDGIRLIRSGTLFTFNSSPVCRGFRGILKNRKYELIHLHLPNPLAMYYTSRYMDDRKLVISWHSDIVRQKYMKKIFHGNTLTILGRAHRIIVPTEFHVSSSEYLPGFKEKCVTIPYGIDVERFGSERAQQRIITELRNRFRIPVVLFVGRLVAYKGIPVLLEALRYINAALVIAGKGPLETHLRKIVRGYGIENRVMFTGEIPAHDLPSYYHACDVFCLPSTRTNEAFGIVQLEAMAAGKPVICTDLPTGVKTVTMHGDTGLIVPAGDSTAMKNAIQSLISNPEQAKNMGQNGLKRVKTVYDRTVMAQQILAIYNALTGIEYENSTR